MARFLTGYRQPDDAICSCVGSGACRSSDPVVVGVVVAVVVVVVSVVCVPVVVSVVVGQTGLE